MLFFHRPSPWDWSSAICQAGEGQGKRASAVAQAAGTVMRDTDQGLGAGDSRAGWTLPGAHHTHKPSKRRQEVYRTDRRKRILES